MNNQSLILQALAIADQASERVMTIYRTDFKVDIKDDNSPVTEADLAAHRIILSGLQALTPDIPILSEESDSAPWSERRHWSRFWLVDPIDGTKEFTSRTGEFTVNIALIDQGRPVLGVVTAPALGEAFWGLTENLEPAPGHWGEKGGWKRDAQGEVTQLRTVSPPARKRVLASKSHMDNDTRAFIRQLGPHQLIQAGSSLKLCRIAEGRADIYPRMGPTSEWDTGAGHAVLAAAGGKLVQLDGSALQYGKEDVLNPCFIAAGSWYK